MPPPLIEATDLVKRYADSTAVDGVSFHVDRNECFGLLGPNGAGKSTTIKMLSAVAPPTSGTLTVAGLDVSHHARAVKRMLGVVPQDDNLDPDLPVRKNLEVYAATTGFRRSRPPRVSRSRWSCCSSRRRPARASMSCRAA